jgi:type III restriction enzyme
MDKGAHFYRCDFQVHTPRDLNWGGATPATPAEREAYAKEFVKACRSKGIGSVAITDHHDVTYFPHIKKAANEELDDNGVLIPSERRLVVFPGMELTLGVPCQALLIFDSELPPEFLTQAQTRLGIVPAPDADKRHAQIGRLDHLKNLNEVCTALDELSVLKNKYILLPNVNNGGQFTLMRTGFLAHYKDMPCVGGYLDHAIDGIDVGNKNILEGKVEAYNFKAIGIFPTSDNRQRDFANLGVNVTWVKWSEPTAEALRQACLARQTRIAHQQPQSPVLLIESIQVSNSKFLGPIDLEINPQFNCLIGSRGTGKSTILEYLRWGLCDQPAEVGEEDDVPNLQSKRKALIANTLVPHGASVTVNISLNGVPHAIRRKSDTNEVLLKVGTDEFKPVREQDIRELFAVQGYSQKQLSSVGVRAEELLRFVIAPIAKQLAELDEQKTDATEAIRANYAALQRKKGLSQALLKHNLEIASLEMQLQALKASLSGLTTENAGVLAQHERFTTEQSVISQWQRDVDRLHEIIRKAKADLQSLPKAQSIEGLPNQDILTKMQSAVDKAFSEAKKRIDGIEPLFTEADPNWAEFPKQRREWDAKFEAHNLAYQTVKQQATAHQDTITQINTIEGRLKELRDSVAERQSALNAYETAETEYRTGRQTWRGLFSKKADLIEVRCQMLTDLSNGAIRASLKRGAATKGINDRLSTMLDRTGIRSKETKIAQLCENIAGAANPPELWEIILGELELLIPPSEEPGPRTMPATPQLSSAGFTAPDIEKLATRMTTEDWLELSLVELSDEPAFEYKQREAEYIPFADASAGQQATSLLRVLLNQEGPPLLIDQPEDDLDNQVIHAISTEIWTAKGKRQLIFTSHNANLVVNGDADLVVVCDYRITSDQSGGKIKCQGAIDGEEVRKEITTIMEGGKTAFRLRKEKYGF